MMKNVDVDIYLNHFKTFFDKNPNDLTELLGDVLVNDFYNKVEEQCYKNLEKGEDISVTRQQLIEIVVELKSGEIPPEEVKRINKLFQKTKYGSFCLN
jgi:hypothetical protein